jgi:hypothetical protein
MQLAALESAIGYSRCSVLHEQGYWLLSEPLVAKTLGHASSEMLTDLHSEPVDSHARGARWTEAMLQRPYLRRAMILQKSNRKLRAGK